MKEIYFKDYPDFKPNVTPRQMFELGVFGGQYWRPIYSSIVNKNLKDQYKEFPFFRTLNKDRLANDNFDITINYFKAKSGTSLEYWESKNWITHYDPYGWVQWYCRFYSGRRCPDDERQVKRWLSYKSRWIAVLQGKQAKNKDTKAIQQGLLQWALLT